MLRSSRSYARTAALCWVIVVGAVLWFTADMAGAETTITCEPCSHPYQRWVDEAKVPTPDVTLAVVEDATPCEGADACTEEGAATIWFQSDRQGFYHELGHNFDYGMPEWVRFRYLAILGRLGPWRQPEAMHFSPHELFAESYALCAFRLKIPPSGLVQGQGPVGGWQVHNRVCHLIGRIG